mmetsp:Transcript_27073/g.26132  ORF Transcript_27073/g.26132 Transcript_27073/m.26132 type:complete len:131 (-) Transcript_27073:254-646(-)|eukprot:CAMPEP_0170567722 /NCGR_PEP_ID=MMETSP0211-20121228/80669_1 /TAXON_ID=311385 /ORGANISM="Pseudokeronopsis sp., Strain OXSARD2" /LENGTH=130 /DNA_ID=CAMNT_0010889273 /DNA_START=280 /DNA_END=672 /DNA_ORIENTATION=+
MSIVEPESWSENELLIDFQLLNYSVENLFFSMVDLFSLVMKRIIVKKNQFRELSLDDQKLNEDTILKNFNEAIRESILKIGGKCLRMNLRSVSETAIIDILKERGVSSHLLTQDQSIVSYYLLEALGSLY